ncbi:neocarzinostatin apoprotein domain-containing protein [Nocardia jejuensis]|uniref:neocarzinostatin apoprotein domain-containing protein n=1 Tax=Nocardia jejuensis TaxID=328049 RepID=UPI00083664B9|nr:neocarzinostatin apoprotein domain-containing protein [Nocardia jejuensis]
MKRLGGSGFRAAIISALASLALLGGGPVASAAPALVLSPSSGLTAGQTVTVTLDGLTANMPTVAVGQCKPQIVQPTDCNLTGSLMGQADAQGVWQPAGGNHTLALVSSIGGTDCTSAPGACTISVTSLTDPSNILTSVPLTFGAAKTPETTVVAGDSATSDSDDSNTGLIVGIAVAVVVVVLAVTVVAVRRRGSGTR